MVEKCLEQCTTSTSNYSAIGFVFVLFKVRECHSRHIFYVFCGHLLTRRNRDMTTRSLIMQYKILCKKKMKLNFNDTGHLGMAIFFFFCIRVKMIELVEMSEVTVTVAIMAWEKCS